MGWYDDAKVYSDKKTVKDINGDSRLYNIVVDANMKTNIDGLYACGNATGGLLQVSKAVYEGSIAGLSAARYVN